MMNDTLPVSLVKATPLATGTVYEVPAEHLRVGDVLILGNLVTTITAVLEPVVERTGMDYDIRHRFEISPINGRHQAVHHFSRGAHLIVLRDA